MRKLHDDKLYIQVFRELRAYILQNNLKPGDLIPTEMELCGMLSVSRNVLREAIKAMELMGIVRSRSGRGTEICPFSLDFIFQNVLFSTAGDNENTILEMLNIRKKIELGYMREAFRTLSDRDIADIRGIFEQFRVKHESRMFDHDDDRRFHMAIFTPLNNKTLNTLLDSIWEVDATFQVEEKMRFTDTTTVHHENILVALESRNEEAFIAAMLAHFSSGKYAPDHAPSPGKPD